MDPFLHDFRDFLGAKKGSRTVVSNSLHRIETTKMP